MCNTMTVIAETINMKIQWKYICLDAIWGRAATRAAYLHFYAYSECSSVIAAFYGSSKTDRLETIQKKTSFNKYISRNERSTV